MIMALKDKTNTERAISRLKGKIEDLQETISELEAEIEEKKDELRDLEEELELVDIPSKIQRSDPAWYKGVYPSPTRCPECNGAINDFLKQLLNYPGEDRTLPGEAYAFECDCGAVGEWYSDGSAFGYELAITKHKDSKLIRDFQKVA
jgi:hypothetical protein